jgi:hypothetical protein
MKKIQLQELLCEQMLYSFCEGLETQLQEGSVQVNSTLAGFLKESETKIFKPMGIKPSDNGKYFIAGSARLYLYPELTEILKLKPNPGDLDIVVTDENAWKTLEKKYKGKPLENEIKQYIFRPTPPSNTIEAFKEWKPGEAVKDKSEVKDTSVRSSTEIQEQAKLVEGYYYMSMYDILDYKLKLGREKEIPLTEYLMQYHNESDAKKKEEIKKSILGLFANNEQDAKDFLNPNFQKQLPNK